MEILELTFQLGVFFAIYGFIWFFVDLGFMLLNGGKPRSLVETYFFKGIQYVFLVNVIFLFSIDMNSGSIALANLYPIIFILALYFIGKFQKSQNNVLMLSRMGLATSTSKFNSKYEIIIIILSLLVFIGFIFRPDIANNVVAFWFKESILDIESTAIIGFIFKVIGFFFLMSILFKTVNSFQYISESLFTKNQRKDSDFDDYEEIS
ncbi:MAG: hypothetical protein ACPG9L_04350 [Crocinitomicaceae bacterium]|tara:strand:+ start:1832 stop:2452 length:621 start_codon:yes stop_codon:yes gene_type:complete